jgi:hypothetical protein
MDSSEKVWLNLELPDNQNSFIQSIRNRRDVCFDSIQ